MFKSYLIFYLFNLMTLLVLIIISLSIGVAPFSWTNLWHHNNDLQLIFISRLPRTFAALLTGASMAVAGTILQILMKNRFIEPSMIGASQSAALALLLITLFFPASALILKMSIAASGAIIGMGIFILLIRKLPPTMQLLVPLTGIILSGIIEAVTTFIAYENDMLQMLSVWQQGDFSGILQGRYELLWLTGIATIGAYILADRLTIAGLGNTISINLGLNRHILLWTGVIMVAIITSLIIVTVGNIPFIGLIVPNIASRIMGDKLRQSLPIIAFIGASLVLLCDIIGRILRYPFEVPVSTIFGVFGTLLFLYLLLRKPNHAH